MQTACLLSIRRVSVYSRPAGSAETLAYLPKCDLGVVLIDAGSTLTYGDVRTILALEEAAIPVHVLLSKADILDRSDCEKTLEYVKQHIISDGFDLAAHPVSVHTSHRDLLDRWFGEEILPLYSRSQELGPHHSRGRSGRCGNPWFSFSGKKFRVAKRFNGYAGRDPGN